MKKIKTLLILSIIILYSVWLTSTVRFVASLDIPTFAKNLSLIQKKNEILSYIDKFYYQKTDQKDLENGVYRGLLEGLDDPYSTYFTAEEYKEFNVTSTGKYAGIGAVLSQNQNTKVVTVIEVYDDSPAKNAGISKSDTIVSVDGIDATSVDLQTLVSHLRGKEDTKVTVVFSHEEDEQTVEITRRVIVTPTVESYMLDENTGYIRISEFKSETEKEFMDAIHSLEKQGMENVIYDIRYNPGGLVKTTTDILDDMLPEGVTVYMMDKYGKKVEYTSDEENQLPYPCVVLVNEDSASASEIFAGAIRDFNYGKILGSNTYGKGVVQNIYPLSDGSALKLTISEYFTPKGENIHKKGIKPDIMLEYEYTNPEDKEYTWEHDNQILRALKELD